MDNTTIITGIKYIYHLNSGDNFEITITSPCEDFKSDTHNLRIAGLVKTKCRIIRTIVKYSPKHLETIDLEEIYRAADENDPYAKKTNKIMDLIGFPRQAKNIERINLEKTDQVADEKGFRVRKFDKIISLIGLPRQTELDIKVEDVNGQEYPGATITLIRKKVESYYKNRFSPIVVNGIPRSGTTWLMHILAGHPEIISYIVYPYEWRFSVYWLHLLDVLCRPTTGPNDNWKFQQFRECIIRQPYFPWVEYMRPWFGSDYPSFLADFCKKTIDSVNSYIAKLHSKDKAVYFAEKWPGTTRNIFAELYNNYREIIIIRDFRDVFCSVIAFNKARGFDDFDRRYFTKDADYLRHLGKLTRAMYLEGKQSSLGNLSLVVKYEDLIQKPFDNMKKIFDWLEVDSNQKILTDIIERPMPGEHLAEQHLTSGNQLRSIERWRTDLPDDLKRIAVDEFGPLLDEQNYALE